VAGCCGALKSVLLVLLCPITCPLGYCLRRKPPAKQTRQDVVVLPAPPQEVIYEKSGPARVKYIDAPQVPYLCPVFVPNDFKSLPNEGIQRLDILQLPEVPIGFHDMRFIDPHSLDGHHQGSVAAQLHHINPMQIQGQNIQGKHSFQQMQNVQSFPQMQNGNSSVSNDVAISGWMPMGSTR
jgi:hypothetical protein